MSEFTSSGGTTTYYCVRCGKQVGGWHSGGTNIFCTCQPEDLRAALAASQQEVTRLSQTLTDEQAAHKLTAETLAKAIRDGDNADKYHVERDKAWQSLALARREVERLAQESRCLDVKADAWRDTYVIANTELAALRAALALAQKDGERLALLAKWAATPLELDRMGGLEGDEPVGPFFLTFRSGEDEQFAAATLRDVIDEVAATLASRHAASLPPETKP